MTASPANPFPVMAERGIPPEGIRPAQRMALALSLWPAEQMHRTTLRSFLPPGAKRDLSPAQRAQRRRRGLSGTKGSNPVTKEYQQRLKVWHNLGRIERGEEWVRILDRPALAEIGAMLPEAASRVLHEALNALLVEYRTTADERQREIRRRELCELQALMQNRGSHHHGRGSARVFAAGDLL